MLELATQQHGVVSTRQLARLGYSRSSASKANKVGRLHRVHRGVYAVGHRRLTPLGWHMAATLACRPAVVSHGSAAWLFGLLQRPPGTIHLTSPSRRRAKRSFTVHFSVLPESDLTVIEGIPATALPRTLLDFASSASPRRLERAIERSEELRLFDLGPVEDLLSRARNHPGHPRLREMLDSYRPDPAFTRSNLERRFLHLVEAAGIERPAMNVNVAGLELDAFWERERFVVELDTYETHGSHAAFERDRIREDDLLLLDIEMIRVTGPRLKREPDAVIARVAAHLARRRRALS